MKKNLQESKILFLFLSVIVFMSSCFKQHLSRDNAKEAIIKKEEFPKPIYYEFNKMYLKDFRSQGSGATANIGKGFDEVKDMINFFQSKGLVTTRDETKSETTTAFLFGTTTRTWIYTHIDLTEEGKKHLKSFTQLGYNVKLWDKGFDQITGVKEMEEQKVAEVNYQIKNDNITPFGEFFSDRSNVENRSVTFSLFDDGWRIN